MMLPVTRSPFMLYMVWHSGYTKGTSIAEQFRRHFGSDRYRNIAGGAGVTVLFRNVNTLGSSTPLEINWDGADTVAVVVLMDNQLATDASWTYYVQRLVNEAESRGFGTRVFPVAINASVLNIGLEVQALRWDRWDGNNRERGRRLLRELAHEFSRMLRFHLGQFATAGDHLGDYSQRIKVFLSHSKHDEHGESVVESFRDWLHQNSSVSSFVDIHNIPAGVSSSSVIFDTIQNSVLVSIYTDSYSSDSGVVVR